MDSTRDTGLNGVADLGEYLSRPVNIISINWSVGSSITQSFNPWQLYIENTFVRKRLEEYKLLQGHLRVRFAINGNPFLYGRAYASYTPRHTEDEFRPPPPLLINNSELRKPHIFLDPTTSSGGEMILPFFNPDNWIDLPGGTYNDMGSILIRSINNLFHANSTSDIAPVTITVYAWFDSVRLSGPTTESYETYVAQSGDEYGTTMVTKTASALARVANLLSDIPSIRPYARATDYACTALARVGHVFGFSRPNVVSTILLHKHRSAGNFSNTDAPDASLKLSVDSKNELSVDPRTVGLSDVDEMAFSYMSQREFYLTTIPMTEANAPAALLRRMVVSPVQHEISAETSPSSLCISPMTTVAVPFRYWRGTIKYRFQIVASQMHRGRLRIAYDPGYIPGLAPSHNLTYNRIVDIATNRDVEMEIGWHNSRSWLLVNDGKLKGNSTNADVDEPLLFDRTCHNGSIGVYVLNRLTSPDPVLAQPIFINVYVSAGKDFEVACPDDDILQEFEYVPQSGEEVIEQSDDDPSGATSIEPISSLITYNDATNHVYMGEDVRSARSLMKRFTYHNTTKLDGVTERPWNRVTTFRNFPWYKGEEFGNVHASSTLGGYNYFGFTPINWFTPAFVGWRGSLRWKHVPSHPAYMQAQRSNRIIFTDVPYRSQIGTLADSQSLSVINWSNGNTTRGCGVAGMAVATPQDGSLEIDLPYYSFKRFSPARSRATSDEFINFPFVRNSILKGHCEEHRLEIFGPAPNQEPVPTSNVNLHATRSYVAAGEDFSLFFFIGSPIIWHRLLPDPVVTVP